MMDRSIPPEIEIEQSDASLIDRSLREPEIFALVFDRHGAQVHRYLARRAGPADADDLMSETFLTAFKQRDRFTSSRSPTGALPWLLGIATNLLRMHQRSETRRWAAWARTGADPAVPAPADQVADRVDAEVTFRLMAGVLEELADGDRDALLLFAWAGLTYEEIAAALDVPTGTVRSRLHRARLRLRTALSTTNDDGNHDHG
ncbi:RNA polymerase sigma-70 factor, ECF subfamily [Nonomuraea solani]|uniref:RNA polymerase sigma-70 factor, ECF subfamily n=1 Tax=Nonomuraea solani TaxID=1144553 RepID=A0A1H6ERW5_9ACTN|nr:RNA polymerase sigma factor [Nonomuraea solani]SEG99831.1 RNA polymerase sigma-70 factor, ECF subfamily [Nonomuraea solani]